ncbi:single-stranded dna-binding protein [Companilactobacillus tucceti DSM 20183]|uniref:Single-stranded DNA-binding protein n=1 Tax=Companilactobacillus tucceti DSM 20183 TaxID=1423811 RepID=A0A0R1IYL4_9LACO|nr:single-stranded dna-binding protein [Companilactobacillus tucceti DSM 20183]
MITGRLTKRPDLKYTQSGIAVTQFTVAVNRAFKDSNGERQADFINCVMWRKAAENFTRYVDKGSLVGIDGRIQTRTYKNKEGTTVYVTEVVADQFTFLESKKDSTSGQSGSNWGNSANNSQNGAQGQNDPFQASAQSEVKDDDLPF